MGDVDDQGLATIAILVSRVEALCLADMLRVEGILVHVGGDAHASVQVISLALGGHRIMVPVSQYAHASDLIREVGARSPLDIQQRAAESRCAVCWLVCRYLYLDRGCGSNRQRASVFDSLFQSPHRFIRSGKFAGSR